MNQPSLRFHHRLLMGRWKLSHNCSICSFEKLHFVMKWDQIDRKLLKSMSAVLCGEKWLMNKSWNDDRKYTKVTNAAIFLSSLSLFPWDICALYFSIFTVLDRPRSATAWFIWHLMHDSLFCCCHRKLGLHSVTTAACCRLLTELMFHSIRTNLLTI